MHNFQLFVDSLLKYIKNRLHTFMDGGRLNQLAIMSSESDSLRKLDFQNVIDKFVQIIFETITRKPGKI
jgi:hypothetical protein